MEISRALLGEMLREAVIDPRASARRILSLGVPLRARQIGVVLAAVLSVLLLYLSYGLTGARDEGGEAVVDMLPPPFAMVLLQVAVMLLTALAVNQIGARFGGRGKFWDVLVLVVWLQMILMLLQAAQIVLLIVLPPFGMMVSYVALGMFFWLLTGFVAEVHGFESRGRVLAGIIGSFIVLSMVLAVALSLLIGAPRGM